MTKCSDYEIELSALVDGESDPAMALKLVEHIASCASCSEFVRDLRGTQEIVDGLEFAPRTEASQPDVVPLKHKSRRILGLRPQWAVGIAALLVATVGVLFSPGTESVRTITNDFRNGEITIRLEEDKGKMSDERFVALVSELLRADRRYQNQMYVVLNEVAQNGASSESGPLGSANRPEGYDDEYEPSGSLTAAME